MGKSAKADIYMRYLQEHGYQPKIDSDGDVFFMKEGRAYFIAVDENDDEFFRICFPNFWSIEDEKERRDVLVACDHANALCKVAKVFTVRDNTWATIEIFVNDVRDFEPMFERSMSALMTSVYVFVEKMRELR